MQQFMIFFSDGRPNTFRWTFERSNVTYDAVVHANGNCDSPTGNDIDDQVGMFPGFELGGADIDRGAADTTEQDVGISDDEFAHGVTHRRRSIAAPSRLMKQDRAVLPDDFFDEPERCRCRRNLVFQACLREAQKSYRRGRKRPRRQVLGSRASANRGQRRPVAGTFLREIATSDQQVYMAPSSS